MGGKVTDLAEKVFSMPLNGDTLNTIYKISSLIDSLTKPSSISVNSTVFSAHKRMIHRTIRDFPDGF